MAVDHTVPLNYYAAYIPVRGSRVETRSEEDLLVTLGFRFVSSSPKTT